MSSNQSTEVYDFMRWCLYGKRHQFFSVDFFSSCIQTNDNHSSKKSCFCPEIHFFSVKFEKEIYKSLDTKDEPCSLPFFLSIFFHSLFLVYLTFRYLLFYFSFSLFIHFVILIFLPLSLLFYFVLSAPSPPLFLSFSLSNLRHEIPRSTYNSIRIRQVGTSVS